VATLLTILLVAQPLGRPLFYWGARPAVIETGVAAGEGVAARVTEVHGVVDQGDLVLRVSFDRPIQEALYLPSGAPVSGRLRAALYVDADADRLTGWAASEGDARVGADYRVDLGVLALGADPSIGIEAQAVVTASVVQLTPEGRQRSLWRGDHTATPEHISLRGDAVEVRLPAGAIDVAPNARLTLIADGEAYEGRLEP
jgi:hypothetical protein